MQRITILGATGSIGVSTLDVLARHPDKYRGLRADAPTAASTNWPRSAARFRPGARRGRHARGRRAPGGAARPSLPTDVAYGEAALCEIASGRGTDTVMAAIVGAAGLAPTLAAARAGKKVLLANKEALVMSGQLFMDAVREHTAPPCCRSTASTMRSSSRCPRHYAPRAGAAPAWRRSC